MRVRMLLNCSELTSTMSLYFLLRLSYSSRSGRVLSSRLLT